MVESIEKLLGNPLPEKLLMTFLIGTNPKAWLHLHQLFPKNETEALCDNLPLAGDAGFNGFLRLVLSA